MIFSPEHVHVYFYPSSSVRLAHVLRRSRFVTASVVRHMTHSFALPAPRHPTFATRNTSPSVTACRRHSSRCAIEGEPVRKYERTARPQRDDTRGFTRRDAIVFTPACFAAAVLVSSPAASATPEEPRTTANTAVFVDRKNLFRVEYPQTWQPVSKAGAALLLRDPSMKYSTIGVTITPVKINSLKEFGDAREIGQKLLAAEAAKESTYPGGVALVSEETRVASGGATFYEYEYRLLTTRGNKVVFVSCAVEGNTLFIMNAQVFEKKEGEAGGNADEVEAASATLRKVVSLFDVGPSVVVGL
jgi:hypothetical protein